MDQYQEKYVLLEILINAEDRPVSRHALQRLTGNADRINRRHIEELRAEGVPIVSIHGEGYRLAKTTNEKQMIINDYRSRATRMLMTARAIENSIAEQTYMDVVDDWRQRVERMTG